MLRAQQGVEKAASVVFISRRNFAIVRIFYEKLNSFTFVEQPAYTFYQLISDIGGVVCIVLGLSILTCIEIFHCLLGLVVFLFSRGKVSIIHEK